MGLKPPDQIPFPLAEAAGIKCSHHFGIDATGGVSPHETRPDSRESRAYRACEGSDEESCVLDTQR